MSSRRGLHPSSGGSGTGSPNTVTTADGGTTRLADVPPQAGVSESTVSRVVNNKPGINPATRQAVTAALQALGYQSQEHLRERQDRLIGMIMPELDNPIFALFARALGAALIQQGYTPALHTLA